MFWTLSSDVFPDSRFDIAKLILHGFQWIWRPDAGSAFACCLHIAAKTWGMEMSGVIFHGGLWKQRPGKSNGPPMHSESYIATWTLKPWKWFPDVSRYPWYLRRQALCSPLSLRNVSTRTTCLGSLGFGGGCRKPTPGRSPLCDLYYEC